MFKRVLIAEDHESANISVQKTLQELQVAGVDYAYYCDDALLRIRKAVQAGEPYELLITDLSFEEDGRVQALPDGPALIRAARALQPGLKVLVFSAEQKAAVIEPLFKELRIDGYVRKARRDAQELKLAVETIGKNRVHFPAHLRQVVSQKNAYAFSAYDVTLVSLLAGGMSQKDIPAYLLEREIRPASLSSVEKRLNQIRLALEFTKNEQLVGFCKDMGII
jgi:DNA-binding NarL/FixJ family response regulator